ncbi:MAG: hypothetical protein NDJ72_09395, partial [Elusimicrobia bacterium]|nr:hypothetical protein [Elusimicrobiota bacterium]
MSQKPEPVAIVGAGGIFPDAPAPARFWENLVSRRCSARDVPAGRWALPADAAFDPAFHLALHAAREALAGAKL